MINKKALRSLILGISVASGVFLVFGQGCGIGFQSSSSSSNGGLLGGAGCDSGPSNVIDKNYEVVPGRRTVSIVYGEQMLNSFVSCTGIGEPSQRTRDEWMRRSQSLSEYGGLADVSGAMMMAIAGVAAEVCQDVVDRERPLAPAQRSIFGSTLLTGTGLSQADINAAADMMGLACWQRMPSSEERIEISNAIGSLSVNSQLGAVSLCTAMLSSFAAVEQ